MNHHASKIYCAGIKTEVSLVPGVRKMWMTAWGTGARTTPPASTGSAATCALVTADTQATSARTRSTSAPPQVWSLTQFYSVSFL